MKRRNKPHQWFDIRDHEYTECRMKLNERLHALKSLRSLNLLVRCSLKPLLSRNFPDTQSYLKELKQPLGQPSSKLKWIF